MSGRLWSYKLVCVFRLCWLVWLRRGREPWSCCAVGWWHSWWSVRCLTWCPTATHTGMDVGIGGESERTSCLFIKFLYLICKHLISLFKTTLPFIQKTWAVEIYISSFPYVSICSSLDCRVMRDPSGFIPSPMDRYRQILLPTLRLFQVILTSTSINHQQGAAQVGV